MRTQARDPTAAEEARPARLVTLSRAALSVPQLTRDGRTMPAQSAGTVVDALAEGKAYIIEFVEPFDALPTVDAGLVRAADD